MRRFTRLTACLAASALASGAALGDGLSADRWTATQSFPIAGYQYGAVAHNGWVYVAGGYSPELGEAFDTVWAAQVNVGGSLGPWTVCTELPESDQGPGVAIVNNHMFVAMGNGNIYSAPINADGSIGTWSPEAMAAAWHGGRLSLEGYCNRLYLFGGWHNSTFYPEVYTATVAADGSLGPWVQLINMPEGRQHVSVHFFNDRVYIVGGITSVGDGGILDTAWSAPVNPVDGTLAAWRAEATLPNTLWYHNSLLVNGEIFLIGGRTGYSSGAVNTILRGVINPVDGTILSWESAGCLPPDYPEGVGAVYVEAAGGFAYLIGGGDRGGTTALVYRNDLSADINDDGETGIVDFLILLALWGSSCRP